MPSLESVVTGFVPGDHVSIRRTIDRDGGGAIDEVLPAGAVISKAWLTVKNDPADADPGLLQKEITTTNVPGVGHIENDGTGDVDPVLRFDLVPADTRLIGYAEILHDAKYFDVQVLTSGGNVHTPEAGRIKAGAAEVTVVDA